jgi:hypothetical protein
MHSEHSGPESGKPAAIHDSLIQLPLERPRHATICAKSAARITVRFEGAKGA